MYFKSSGVNPFLDTEDEHLSTFAMDVDTASYSITRRYLTEGHFPPSEAVRVEEFVNAFKYDYAAPTDGAFAIHLEGAPSIFADSKRTHLLRIGLKGRVIPDEDRKDAALTFVVDVSGSMEEGKPFGTGEEGVDAACRSTPSNRQSGHRRLRLAGKAGVAAYGSEPTRRDSGCHRFPIIRKEQPMPKKGCASDTISLGATRRSITSIV